jgi:hypothetical protein
MNRKTVWGPAALCFMLLFISCGKSAYKDGVYTGISSADDMGA